WVGPAKNDTDISPRGVNVENHQPTSDDSNSASPVGKFTTAARALMDTNQSSTMQRTPICRANATDHPETSTTTTASTNGYRLNSNRQPCRVFNTEEIRP